METEEELFDFNSKSTESDLEITSLPFITSEAENSELKDVKDSISSEIDENHFSSFEPPKEIKSDSQSSCNSEFVVESLEMKSDDLNEFSSSDKDIENILSESEIFSSIYDFESEPSQSLERKNTFSSLDRKVKSVNFETEDDHMPVKRQRIVEPPPHQKTECSEANQNKIEFSGFLTGNNKKITLITKKQPKFVKSGVRMPPRSFLKPEKGHKSSFKDEKESYINLFGKIRSKFKKDEIKWLKIQFRWVWIHLNLNNLPLDVEEITKHLQLRKSTEYSILRRIVEGDDVSYRYMVLLVIDTGPDYVEGYDGFYSVKISVDLEIQKEIKNKKLQIGTKIKLFGCKLLIESGVSIFDITEGQSVMYACYNGFCYASRTRKLGYKKKISFLRAISSIKKEGGVVSCIVGNVKRIIETKYVVQVKDYRNTVDNIEREYENIMLLMEKYNEEIKQEDIKIRMYIRFILEEGSSECLITSWMYIDKIKQGVRLMFCGLEPVVKSMGLHLTTTKRTYIKFLI